MLEDTQSKKYLDGNASIWTNLHGHNHPKLNRAIERQLKQVAHTSALGLANEPASLLAEQLVKAVGRPLRKIFYSDDGSTALEVALKMAFEFAGARGVHGLRAFFLWTAHIMETRLGPRVLATLICFIKPMAACCLNQTRQCHRRVIDVRLIGPSRNARMPGPLANASGNAWVKWSRS